MAGADPNQLLQMMDDPNFLQQMNEAMDNPAVIEMMQNSPMVRQNPMVAEMLRNPELRRAMFNPEMMRMQLQMQRAMNQSGGGGSSFPMPGATNTTPQTGAQDQSSNPTAPNPGAADPFASLLGGGGLGGAGGNNPFAALLSGGGASNPWGPPPQNQASTPSTGAGANTSTGSTENTQGAQNTSASPQPPANPFASLFGTPPAGAGGAQQSNPIAEMSRQMMQNPEMMRAAMQMMGGAGGSPFGQPPSNPADGSNPPAANPFASLFGPGGGFGGGGFGTPPPQDNRPPEEVYESQLRQLNEMGFYEFERNVTALRRSGGNVQAAIEFLLVSIP